MKVIDSCKFRSVLQTALIISQTGSLLNRLNLAVPVWFLSKALLCPILDFFFSDIVHENLKMGSDGESDQASGTSSDEVQSPTGVCLRNRVHRRISMEVRRAESRHTCTHLPAYAASPHTTLHLLSSPSARLLHCLKWFGRGLGPIVCRLMGSKSRGVMILIAALLPEDKRRGW